VNELTPNSKRPPVASAIITDNGKVLLVRRRVKEGSLSWQFPGGEVEPGESAGQAAVREVREETGLIVAESKSLGERVHPNTGRKMIYVACDVVKGNAKVVDDEELDDLAWADQRTISEYVPYGFYGPVQEYLNATLSI
jgi:8-oxo-dGTP diphosphatase